MSCNLQGIGVLVTRPDGQAKALCDLITKHGGNPIHFPVITIDPPDDKAAAKLILNEIGRYDVVIFISPNSVRYSLDLISGDTLPANLLICAVGKGTARVLEESGIKVDVSPEGPFDSESLLAMPELSQVAAKNILIVRGNGGRGLLGDTLRKRGAVVDYVEVYSRKISSQNPDPLITEWDRGVNIVTVTSCGILDNLFTLLGDAGRAKLCSTPLIVVSQRIKSRAQEHGCNTIVLASEASDQGLLYAICEWRAITSR
jgi:uroporphyrinogen-III synthase